VTAVQVTLTVWTMDDETEEDVRHIVRTAMRTQLSDFRIGEVRMDPATAPPSSRGRGVQPCG
jgi:hypothetical protein